MKSHSGMIFRILTLTLLASLTSSHVSAGPGGAAFLEPSQETACRSNERWTYFDGSRPPLENLAWVLHFREAHRMPKRQAWIQYALGRTLLQMDLPHLALHFWEPLRSQRAIRNILTPCLARATSQGDRDPIFEQPDWISGVEDLRKNHLTSAIKKLTPRLHKIQDETLRSSFTLQLARAQFGLGQYAEAIQHYRSIPKSSNDTKDALTELAWAQLKNEQLHEAIGTTLLLQAGSLKNTYHPESLMVLAMAFNELCQYSPALQAVQSFRKNYAPIHVWLSSEPSNRSYYPDLVKALKTSPTSSALSQSHIPTRLINEWLKSQEFQKRQREINLFFEEEDRLNSIRMDLKSQITRKQKQLLEALPKIEKQLTEVLQERTKNPSDHPWPTTLLQQISSLRSHYQDYLRLTRVEPILQPIGKALTHLKTSRSKTLISEINHYVNARNQIFLSHLNEISENLELIEIEILNGASQDIVWKNAHPDYSAQIRSVASGTLGTTGTLGTSQPAREASQLSWGSSPASAFVEGDSIEIWEDELGSFRADLPDHCKNKDRYLALKMKKGISTP